MALTYTELQSVTNDYFSSDGGKVIDVYFQDSFLMDYTMNKGNGIMERPNGGLNIRIPLMYDGAEGGFFRKTDSLTSDDRTNVNVAIFQWKHIYSNATIYREDELLNAGTYAEVQLLTARLDAAQKTIRKIIANGIYSASGDSALDLTGLRSMTNSSTSWTYGNLAQTDLTAVDGTQPWTGKLNSSSEGISLPVLRTLASDAKINMGAEGKPNIMVTTETLFNVVSGILQAQQRFTEDKDTANAGFTNLVFENKIIAADDYCPSGYLFGLNTRFWGWAIHARGMFVRTPWYDLLNAGVAGRSMKIFWDGNLVCSNRKAHKAHSNLS